MSDVNLTDNTGDASRALDRATLRALEIIGGKIESYAKQLCAPLGPKGNPMRTAITAQLRNSITHRMEGGEMIVGSNLNMAAYVELGTGKEYDPPPKWMENHVERGKHGGGLSHWIFYDEEKDKFRVGLPMKPTPFLRPAVEDHRDEYKHIMENELHKG